VILLCCQLLQKSFVKLDLLYTSSNGRLQSKLKTPLPPPNRLSASRSALIRDGGATLVARRIALLRPTH
jgi:hypothetical protein